MRRHAVFCAAALIAGALVPTPANAQPTPRVGERVSVTACPTAGVTATCLMMRGPNGAVYNVTGLIPPPPSNTLIRVEGTVTDKLSMCNQGIVLDNMQWTRVEGRFPN